MIRVVVGCLFASLVAPAAWLLCGMPFKVVASAPPFEGIGLFWMLGGGIALLLILFLGIPIYLALSTLRTATFFSAGLIGVIVGAISGLAFNAFVASFTWEVLAVFTLTGMLTGCAFYLPVATLVQRSRLALSLGAVLLVSWGVIGWSATGAFVHPDFSIDLGNGYRLVRANDYETYIAAPQSVVVPGKVTQYAVIGDLIIGNAKRPDRPDSESLGLYTDVVEGHFLLDTRARTRQLGLTLPALETALESRGVTDMPPMREPQRP